MPLGSIFDGKVNLNDDSLSTQKFKVVGITQKYIYYPDNLCSSTEEKMGIKSLMGEGQTYFHENKPTIISVLEHLPQDLRRGGNFKNKFFKYDPEVFESNRAAIAESLQEYGMVMPINEMYQNELDAQTSEKRSTLAICIVFAMVSLAMVIVSLLLIFKKDIKKLTTYYLCGYSIKRIFAILSMYCATIGLVSFMAIMVVINWMFGSVKLDFMYYLPAVVVPIALCVISIGVVAIFLKKGKIANRIKGV